MKIYELTYIVSPNITLEEAQTKAKELEEQIQKNGGVILKSEKPIAKTLSYQIKKSGSGFISILEFQAEPEIIEEIISKLKENKDLLRHMILVKNPARKFKERRQRIKPIPATELAVEAVVEKNTEEITEQKPTPSTVKEEKKATVKKVRSEKNKEKAEIEDLDKKLDEILSE